MQSIPVEGPVASAISRLIGVKAQTTSPISVIAPRTSPTRSTNTGPTAPAMPPATYAIMDDGCDPRLNGATFSKAAESAAAAYDYARTDTPTPAEFADARKDVENAQRIGSLAGYIAARVKFEELKDKAKTAGTDYEARIKTAVASVGNPIVPPPLIAKSATIPHELVKGPGEWTTKSRRGGEWRDYEQQATGYPSGMEYDVPRDGGPPVAFDGFEPDAGPNGLLVEAKGKGYDWMIGPDGKFKPNMKAAGVISNELTRQFQVSQQTGIPVEWRVAEPRMAEVVENMIDDAGYGSRIHVVVVPAA